MIFPLKLVIYVNYNKILPLSIQFIKNNPYVYLLCVRFLVAPPTFWNTFVSILLVLGNMEPFFFFF